LRARYSDTAYELLARAGDFAPARDLRLIAMLAPKRPDAQAIAAEASRLEGLYGRPTARTRHALGAAMLMLRQWRQAIPYCEAALQLRPGRHGPWNNLGLAHLRMGNLGEARRCYEQAVAIRPWFPNSLSGLCQTLRNQGDFAAARACAERIRDVCWREYELGNVDVAEALTARREGRPARQRELGAAAQSRFEAAASAAADDVARATTRNPRAAALPACIAYAATLAAGDAAASLPLFLDLVRAERSGRQLANLADLLAEQDVDERERDQLRLLLLEIAIDASPDDQWIRAARDALVEELKTRSR
jgi:tetratricopeptide (TPR) repeat protein